MAKTNNYQEGSLYNGSWFSVAKNWWDIGKQQVGRIAALSFAAVFVFSLLFSRVSKSALTDPVLMGLGALMAIGAMEALLKLSQMIEEDRENHQEKFDALENRVRSLAGEIGEKTYRLSDCQINFREIFGEQVKPHDSVVINHLGLNMSDAGEELVEIVKLIPNDVEVLVNLFVLTADEDSVRDILPKNDLGWCRGVESAISTMEKELEEYDTQLKQRESHVTINVLYYEERPSLHGWWMCEPYEVAYISDCIWAPEHRTLVSSGSLFFDKQDGSPSMQNDWKEQNFDWGKEEYRIVVGQALTPALSRLKAAFCGQIEHLVRRYAHNSKKIQIGRVLSSESIT